MGFINKRIFKNVSIYFSASLIRAFILLAINPFISMNMSHYDFALTGFYLSFNSLLTPLFSLMYGQYYSMRFFKLKTKKERDDLGANLISAQLVFSLFELFFILIAFSFYAKLQKIEFPVYPYATISFSTIIFHFIFTFFLLKLKMEKNAKKFFIFTISRAGLLALLNIILVVIFKLKALGKILSPLFTSLIFAVLLFPKLTTGVKIKKEVIIDSIKFCWPLMIAGSLGYFFLGFDRALLVTLDDNIQLGLYNIALSIAGFLMIFQVSLSQTFQPDIFEAVAKNNKRKLLKIVFGINMLNTIPILIFIIFAPLIINILTAGRFTEAYKFARILSLRNITAGLYYTMSGIIIAYGYSKIALVNKMIGSLISILLFKFLITNYEFYGAAWGQVLSFLGMSIVGLIILLIKKKNYIRRFIK